MYYQSGSLYSCRPDGGRECPEYEGDQLNYRASLAIVESFEHQPPLHYLVVLMSNVLGRNVAEAHEGLATRIHELIESLHQPGADAGPAVRSP